MSSDGYSQVDGKGKKNGVIDHIKNAELSRVESMGKWDTVSFVVLVLVTLFSIAWNAATMGVRASEKNALGSSLCLDDSETICKILPRDSRVLYDDLATGVPLAPSGYLYLVVWIVIFTCQGIHALLHFLMQYGFFGHECCDKTFPISGFKMFNWAVHSLLILYQITLALWPMAFSFQSLWLASGMVFIAACIIRSVAVSASKDKSGKDSHPFIRWIYTETLVAQPAWLALATLVSATLALKTNISTITLGDDWAALWIALYVIFACGLAFYTYTLMPVIVAFGAVLSIYLRSRNTFEGDSVFDDGTYRLTDGFCIGSFVAIGLSFVAILVYRVRKLCKC